MFGKEPLNHKGDVTLRRLLHALECARSRLAVAMAAESKVTPPARWRDYVEVEDRLRRCLRRLKLQRRLAPADSLGWTLTLDALQRLPGKVDSEPRRGEAQHLYQHLLGVLARIEAQETVTQEAALHAE